MLGQTIWAARSRSGMVASTESAHRSGSDSVRAAVATGVFRDDWAVAGEDAHGTARSAASVAARRRFILELECMHPKLIAAKTTLETPLAIVAPAQHSRLLGGAEATTDRHPGRGKSAISVVSGQNAAEIWKVFDALSDTRDYFSRNVCLPCFESGSFGAARIFENPGL